MIANITNFSILRDKAMRRKGGRWMGQEDRGMFLSPEFLDPVPPMVLSNQCMPVKNVRSNLIMYLHAIGKAVQHKSSGASHFLRLDHGFEVGQKTHVFRHVGGQHLHTTRR